MTKGEQTRQKIIEATVALMLSDTRASVSHIIKQTHVSRTTFYRHFPSLGDAILAATLTRFPTSYQSITDPAELLELVINTLDQDLAFFVHFSVYKEEFDFLFKQLFFKVANNVQITLLDRTPVNDELVYRAISGIVAGWMTNTTTIKAADVKGFIQQILDF